VIKLANSLKGIVVFGKNFVRIISMGTGKQRYFNQVQGEAQRMINQMMKDPAFWRHVFKPRPRWIPKWFWKLILRIVVK